MESNQLYLFKDRRFLPIFIVQFFGCFNDSLLKNALIILITYQLSSQLQQYTCILVLLANAIFVIPFIIFASIAGQLADRYERSTIVKIIKCCEIGIIAASAYGFYYSDLSVLFACVFLMGVHSTFFGPIKYSVLPDHLQKNELMGANGFVEAGTFVSILIGTMIGGFYTIHPAFVMFIAISTSVCGFIASYFVPKSNNYNPDIKVSPRIIKETIDILKHTRAKKQVYLAILGISWFWFIGAAILAQIPSLTKDILGADEYVANLFLAVFSIGVGVGSLWCSRLLGHEITAKYVVLAAIGISLFGIDLCFASRISAITYEPEHLKSISIFLSKKHNWRIIIDLFFLAMIGGLYVVPLFTVMQYFSSPAYRSRVIAANNLVNAIFMAASTLLLSLLFNLGCSVPFVILVISIMNLVVAYYIYQIIPDARIIPVECWKVIFKFFFDFFYKVQVKNIENFHKAGKKFVIVANHISYIDPALMSAYLPADLIFAIDTTMSEVSWVKPFTKLVRALPVDPSNAMAIKSLISQVKKNKVIAIFPEGRISTTGALMKIYEGPGMIADKADAMILPIRIDGTQFTHFSKLQHILKTRIFSKVTITILEPVKFTPPPELDNRARRKYIGEALYDIMSDMMFESSDYKKTLFHSLIDAAKIYGFNKKIIKDFDNNTATYRSVFIKSFALVGSLSKQTKPSEYVGLMMPTMVATTVVFFALQACGRVPTMINFTAGHNSVVTSCHTVGLSVIYTSRKFVGKAKLEDLVIKLTEAGITVIYLEDVASEISLITKLKATVLSFFPQVYYNSICLNQLDTAPAVLLFTSGTEGASKAVALSHRNIQSNRCQVFAKLDFGPHDTVFNALPMFHCFGLNGAIIMMLNGIKSFFYPSPLHYRIIPEIVYDIAATVIFSTDTFLNGYAKYAHPYDFYSIRYIIAGAEKLKPKTRQLWFDKYGVRILEGYGVTEASPVISANTPMHDKSGTVGKLMPKIEYSIKQIEGISEGGKLMVKGPNIMLGYIKPDQPKVIQPLHDEDLGDGWYDTGDIVKVDEDGYLTILGRAKRFAKLAGEMISLSLIEELASKIDSEFLSASVAIDDDTKGEQIILFTTSKLVTKNSMMDIVHEAGVSDLNIPKIVIHIIEIPILTTGKLDYRKMVQMAQDYVSNERS